MSEPETQAPAPDFGLPAGDPSADPLDEAQLASFLARLGCSESEAVALRSAGPSPDALTHLHRRHAAAIAFENLDVMSERPLDLHSAALHRKVVLERRGGFCFELNTLFARLLVALGYGVEFWSARVVNPETGALGPPGDHLALGVSTDRASEVRWLCDVGFGRGFRSPLDLEATEVQGETDLEGPFRLAEPDRTWRPAGLDELGEEARARTEATWAASEAEASAEAHDPRLELDLWREQPDDLEEGGRLVYRLERRARPLEAFASMFAFHQRDGRSPFTQTVVWTRAKGEGRETLLGRAVVTDRPGDRRIQELKSDRGVRRWLEERQPPPPAP